MRPRAAKSPRRWSSRRSSTMKARPSFTPRSRTCGTRMCGRSAARPSASAAKASARSGAPSLRNSARGEAGVGEVEPLDQDADEGAVDVAAAHGGGLFEIRNAHAHDVRVLGGGDGCGALAAIDRQVGHFAEALARSQDAEQLAVLADARFALDHQAEEVAGLALAYHHRAGAYALPVADAHQLPKLGLGEAGEEAHRTQRGELVGVAEHLAPPAAEPGAQRFDQLVGELVAAVEAGGGLLLHRAAHDTVDRLGHLAAVRGGRRRIELGDLVDHAELVRALERQPAGEHLVHDYAERVEIRAVVDQLLSDLLRRHVRGRADAGDLRGLGADIEC